MGGAGFKNSFLWKISPDRLLGKAGLQTPMYRMVEHGDPFGKAILNSGDPAQRWVRTNIRQGVGGMLGYGSSNYSPQPYDYSGVSKLMQQQNQFTDQMAADLLKQQQESDFAMQSAQADSIAKQNQLNQTTINAGLKAADANLQNIAQKPSFQKKSQPQQTSKQFSMPSIENLTFGGK
jgi:hypothetical protein